MSERPPILGIGRIVAEREPGRLFEIELPNGYRALAVVQRNGPHPDASRDQVGTSVEGAFSPYDMSRCRIQRFLGKS